MKNKNVVFLLVLVLLINVLSVNRDFYEIESAYNVYDDQDLILNMTDTEEIYNVEDPMFKNDDQDLIPNELDTEEAYSSNNIENVTTKTKVLGGSTILISVVGMIRFLIFKL